MDPNADVDVNDEEMEAIYEDVLSQPTVLSENVSAAPIKRRRNAIDEIPEELKRRVKRKLFTETTAEQTRQEDSEIEKLMIRPTTDLFVYGDAVLDLRSTLPGYEGASVVLTNIYNTFMYVILYKSTLLALKNRKLAIQLRSVEHNLRNLEKNNYEGAHICLPRLVESLFTMLDYRQNTIYINQLKPVSCVLNRRDLMEHISFRSMEATEKNQSKYIELMFSNPYRFIFVGCAKKVGPQNRNEVSPFPFFGDYYNKAMDDMYEVMYELVTKEIKKAKKELADADQLQAAEMTRGQHDLQKTTAPAMPTNSLQMLDLFSKVKNVNDENSKKLRLQEYLREVKLPLVKKDTVDILVTSGNSGKKTGEISKMSYLTIEKDNAEKGCLKITDADVTEDAIYLSSYVRCRVLLLDQSKFGLQIYTRHAIQLLTIDDRLVKFDELFNGGVGEPKV